MSCSATDTAPRGAFDEQSAEMNELLGENAKLRERCRCAVEENVGMLETNEKLGLEMGRVQSELGAATQRATSAAERIEEMQRDARDITRCAGYSEMCGIWRDTRDAARYDGIHQIPKIPEMR